MIVKDKVFIDLILVFGGGFMEKFVEFYQNEVMVMDEVIID